MTAWRWIAVSVVLAIHDEQLAEHGGATGIRDLGLLESALARPQHLASYEKPDLAQLATAYAGGILRDHPFVDGNKRAALVVANVLLLDHGFDIAAEDTALLAKIAALADASLSEAEFANWLRSVMAPA